MRIMEERVVQQNQFTSHSAAISAKMQDIALNLELRDLYILAQLLY